MRINEIKQKVLSIALMGTAQDMLYAVTIDDDDDQSHHHPHPHDHNSLQIMIEDSPKKDKLDRLYALLGKGEG